MANLNEEVQHTDTAFILHSSNIIYTGNNLCAIILFLCVYNILCSLIIGSSHCDSSKISSEQINTISLTGTLFIRYVAIQSSDLVFLFFLCLHYIGQFAWE